MSFWDNVKKFAQPYADDEYDDYEDEELDVFEEEEFEEAPRPRRRNPFAAEPAAVEYNAPVAPVAAAPVAPAAPAAPVNPAPMAAPAAPGFNGRVVNMGGNKQEVVLFHAKSFDDAAKATEELRNRRAIILNMENVDKALTRRVVDFLSGSIFALDGKVKKIAQSTYLFCPYSMDIVGDLETFQAEAESYI
ncbi:MAG: cell division protein SepF [Oscillospiraceae bacterium]|nr:cell division protein SepF [Oscillospiraceae bacterium]